VGGRSPRFSCVTIRSRPLQAGGARQSMLAVNRDAISVDNSAGGVPGSGKRVPACTGLSVHSPVQLAGRWQHEQLLHGP
jgi:hypothetical protein